MTPERIEELKRVADAALPSAPWRYEQYHRVWNNTADPVCKPYGKSFGEQDVYGQHIATFDPPTVLALLARVEELEGALEPATAGISWSDIEPLIPDQDLKTRGGVLAAVNVLLIRRAALLSHRPSASTQLTSVQAAGIGDHDRFFEIEVGPTEEGEKR